MPADAGVAALANHPALESFMISPQMTPRITDATLATLATIKTLKSIEIDQTVLSYEAGLKQLISERQQADLGSGLGRLTISAPATMPISVAEPTPATVFGLKLNSVSSSLTGAVVTGPTGSPAAVSINLGANPNSGDQISLKFNLPDGTTETVQLTASNAVPTPAGSFAIAVVSAALRLAYVAAGVGQSQCRAHDRDRHARQHLAGGGFRGGRVE